MVALKTQLTNDMLAAIAGLTPATAKPIYSASDYGAGTATRNTGNWAWAAGVNLMPISWWDSVSEHHGHMILIHNQIVLGAKHQFPIGTIGATVKFCVSTSSIQTRTIADWRNPADDLALMKLNLPLTVGGIGFAKALPSDWRSYAPHVGGGSAGAGSPFTTPRRDGLPAILCDQDANALIVDWFTEYQSNPLSDPQNFGKQPTDDDLNDYFENIAGHDSSVSTCLIIDNELVVLHSLLSTGAVDDPGGSGPPVVWHRDAINTDMDAMVAGASLTEVDLSVYDDVRRLLLIQLAA